MKILNISFRQVGIDTHNGTCAYFYNKGQIYKLNLSSGLLYEKEQILNDVLFLTKFYLISVIVSALLVL